MGRDPIVSSTVGVLSIFTLVFSGGIMLARSKHAATLRGGFALYGFALYGWCLQAVVQENALGRKPDHFLSYLDGCAVVV